MEFFRSSPFLRILPAFCLGITLAVFTGIQENVFGLILIVGIGGVIFYLNKQSSYSSNINSGVCFQFVFTALGFILCRAGDDRFNVNHFSNHDATIYRAIIVEQPQIKSGRLRAVAKVNAILEGDEWKSSIGKCYIYFNDTTKLDCGDEIVCFRKPELIKGPLNPGEFDFQFYSSLKRIYHQFRLKNDEWIGVRKNYTLKSYSINLRNRFLSVYKSAGLTGQEFAVMSALVLGYDDLIDKATMSAFSASGTLHVLSVSGMHVGIIFMALSYALGFMERIKYLSIVRILLLLASLWFYALLTGLSPSVIRSAMMFSFVLLGRKFNRSSGIYNSLALSAFTIFLVFDPILLFHPGFQLSFIAVAGIAYFYPKIYGLFYFRYWIADKIFSIVAVSIAAQIVTFPISIFYFNQFPNYFVLANLIIIPLSTIAIFGGIFLIGLGNFNFISLKLGWICEKVVSLLNSSATFIEELPASTIKGITIGLPEVFLILIFTVLITEFLLLKQLRILFSALVLVMLFLSVITARILLYENQHNIVFFSGTKEICFQYNFGRKALLFHSEIDSVRAEKLSDAYCKKAGIKAEFRKSIALSKSNIIEKDYAVLNNSRYILIGSSAILNNPENTNFRSPLCVYYSGKLKAQMKSLYPILTIINDNKYEPENYEIMPANIHRLSKGAKLILPGDVKLH